MVNEVAFVNKNGGQERNPTIAGRASNLERLCGCISYIPQVASREIIESTMLFKDHSLTIEARQQTFIREG